jgi:hypothetical protein
VSASSSISTASVRVQLTLLSQTLYNLLTRTHVATMQEAMGAETYLDIEPCPAPDHHNSSSGAGSSSVPATHWRPTVPEGEASQVLSHPRMAVAAKRADALADARAAANSSSSSSSEASQYPGALRRNFTELTWKLVSC